MSHLIDADAPVLVTAPMTFFHLVSLSVFIFFLIGFVLPLIRLWMRSGTFAMAFGRSQDPIQKLVGAAIATYMTALCAWAICYAIGGAAVVGVWSTPRGVQFVGWALLVVGLTIVAIAQAQMGLSWRMGVAPEPTALVVTGLFRWSRNPIYSGMLTTLAAYLFLSPCPWIVMGWLQFALLIAIQTTYEEQAMLTLHGQDYQEYRARVGRFFPRWQAATGVGEPTVG